MTEARAYVAPGGLIARRWEHFGTDDPRAMIAHAEDVLGAYLPGEVVDALVPLIAVYQSGTRETEPSPPRTIADLVAVVLVGHI